jgi:hypothetical protein
MEHRLNRRMWALTADSMPHPSDPRCRVHRVFLRRLEAPARAWVFAASADSREEAVAQAKSWVARRGEHVVGV